MNAEELEALIRQRAALDQQIAEQRPVRIEELISEALAAGAEAKRLREASAAASARRAAAVAELSALGVSYREIGKRLGVSAPRAGQLTELGRSRKPVPPRSS